MKPASLILLFFLLYWLAGCSSDQQTSEQQKSAPELTPGAELIQVDSLDEELFESLINNREGRLLFINVWATWCIPCREEFPDLVKLVKTYEGENIQFIGISADFPDEVKTKIIPFLESQQANFKNYVQNFEKQEDFINRLNPDWSGALPATFIYDSAGEQQKFLLGKQNFEQFQSAIEDIFSADLN